MTAQQLFRRLRWTLRYPFSRKTRIEAGILNGRYTVNQGRRMLGLPEFATLQDRQWANSYVRADSRGYWFLREG